MMPKNLRRSTGVGKGNAFKNLRIGLSRLSRKPQDRFEEAFEGVSRGFFLVSEGEES
jgi:hypothetical protein